MRKIVFIMTLVMIFGFSSIANATLIDNCDGTITQVRSDGSRLMWLQNANLTGTVDWYTAMDKIDYLNSINYLGYGDWRLPQTLPINGVSYNYNNYVPGFDGTVDLGFNVTSPNHELSYMFYVELGNPGMFTVDGKNTPGADFVNKGPFDNLMDGYYWTGTDFNFLYEGGAWLFGFSNGVDSDNLKANHRYFAWVVRDGDSSPIPEPATMLLLGSLLIGLKGIKRSS